MRGAFALAIAALSFGCGGPRTEGSDAAVDLVARANLDIGGCVLPCPIGRLCRADQNRCVACLADSDGTAGTARTCEPTTNTCIECAATDGGCRD